MAKCKRCGKPARFMLDVCQECSELSGAEFLAAPAAQSAVDPAPATPSASRPELAPVPQGGSKALCMTLGLVFLLIGAYFLLAAPSGDSPESLDRAVVNIHRLVLGQTAATVGAIFLAVGIRPR